MSFTYAELKTAIQDYTENDETSFVNNLDLFIKNAEERLLKNVQLTEFRKNISHGTIQVDFNGLFGLGDCRRIRNEAPRIDRSGGHRNPEAGTFVTPEALEVTGRGGPTCVGRAGSSGSHAC